MKKIDEYIELSKDMKNTSDGGSPSFDFGDFVLIKYQISKKYNSDPREKEELIAKAANNKANKGVRTPKHIEIKRTQDENNNICWVLQEKAPGKCYKDYRSSDPQEQLQLQNKILNAPDTHYDKCVKDLCELFNMGLELKPKNIFYDESKEKGGFTFIDLLDHNEKPLNPESFVDILRLKRMLSFIDGCITISYYFDEKATEEEKIKSSQIANKIEEKIISSMERTIPNFEKHKRWLLRTLPNNTLEFFYKDGFIKEPLELNEQEQKQFEEILKKLVKGWINKLESGKYELWQIYANEIGNDLYRIGLDCSWLYHKANKRTVKEFERSYDYEYKCKKDLEKMATIAFNEYFLEYTKTSNNQFIIQAKIDYEEQHQTKRK